MKKQQMCPGRPHVILSRKPQRGGPKAHRVDAAHSYCRPQKRLGWSSKRPVTYPKSAGTQKNGEIEGGSPLGNW